MTPHEIGFVVKKLFNFSTKSVLKLRGEDLEKYEKKNPPGIFIYLSFAVIRSKVKPIEKIQKKIKLLKMAYPALGNTPGTYLTFQKQGTSKFYQTPFA